MNTTVSRIKEFIDYKGLSVRKFEENVGFSNGAFASQYKNNKSIGSDKIENILHFYPEINAEWLLLGKGEMLKSEARPVEIITSVKDLMPKVVVVDDADRDRIPLVPVKAQAGYLAGYGDPEFIKKLPTYSVPNLHNGTYRMFQVSGHSMYPTLQNNSYVVGEFVENWEYMSDNRVYVVVTISEGIIVKRVINRIKQYESLYCKSDNRDYPHMSVNVQDIKEVWECKMHLSFEFLDPVTNYQKIADLEIEMLKMKEEIQQLKTKSTTFLKQ